MAAMEVIEKPLSEIRPFPGNPRKNAEAVKPVADNIKAHGWNQPIVTDATGTIIIGHTRLEAAKLLGLDTAPVLVADWLTLDQADAARLADNRLGEIAAWDEGLLKIEFEKLMEAGVNLDSIGFSTEEIDGLLESTGDTTSLTLPGGVSHKESTDERFTVVRFEVPTSRLKEFHDRVDPIHAEFA